MKNNCIYFFNRPQVLSIKERVLFVLKLIDQISEWKEIYEIGLNGKIINPKDKVLLEKSIFEYISQPIIKQLKVKEIDPDYTDTVGSTITIKAGANVLKIAVGNNNDKIPNTVIVDHLYESTSMQKKLFVKLVHFLHPITGSITKYEIYNNIMNQELDEFRFGWLTFISSIFQIPAIPPNYIVEVIPENGYLIEIISKEPLDESNGDFLTKVRTLVNLFRKHDLTWR